MSVRLVVRERIGDVDAAEWDSILSPDDLLARHAFVSLCERSGVEDAGYRHFLAYEGGELVAVASASRMLVSLELLAEARLHRAVNRIRSRAPSFLRVPVVICGLPVSFGSSCLRFRRGIDPAAALAAIVDGVESYACESKAAMVCFKELSPEEAAPLEPLRAAGYFRAPSIPYCSMETPWESFDAYLDRMRSGYRRQARQSLAVRREREITVRTVEAFDDRVDEIFALYGQIMERARYQLERLNRPFVAGLARALPGVTSAILVERGGVLLAAGILLRAPRKTTFLLAGHAENPENHAYLNLTLEVVAESIRARTPKLDLGQTSYDLKGRLGASVEPRWLFLKHRTPIWHHVIGSASGLLFPEMRVKPRRVFRS